MPRATVAKTPVVQKSPIIDMVNDFLNSAMETPAAYTAAQIALAAGKTKRTVSYALEGIRPSQTVFIKGQQTPAWFLADLPSGLRRSLEQKAKADNYRDAAAMLARPATPWKPVWPLKELHPNCIGQALLLQRALESSLARRHDINISSAEFDQLGVADYARVFGKTITPRYFRELLKRTVERDAGAEDWARLEIYLPEMLRRQTTAPRPTAAAISACFDQLLEVIQQFKSPAQPSSAEEDLLWLRALEFYQASAGASDKPKREKRALLDFLNTHAPFLAKSFNALRVSFDRKFKAFSQAGGQAAALVDGRQERRGVPLAQPYDPAQIQLVKFTAAERHEGKLAPAVRELAEMGLITDPRIQRCLDTRTSKSYHPQSFHEHFRDLPAFRVAHLGPRALAKMVPPRELTYEGIHSMLCLVGDDLTSPVYVYVPDGEGWFKMTRCQLLCVADFRSLFITSYALNPSGQYNSLDVRTVYTTAFAEHGMPKYILREGGLWRKSKFANSLAAIGTGRSADAPFSDAEVEIGLERAGVRIKSSIDELCRDVGDLGIQFREAYCARAKPIERVFDLLQSLMASEPGFSGRDERVDCPEAVRKNLELVQARKAHPADCGFYSFEQWLKRLDEIVAKYNRTPQEGRRLRSPLTGQPLSPAEAFSLFQDQSDPPIRFDASCSVLMSHMKIPVEVKKPDLRRRRFPCGFVTVRGNTYCNEETGRRIGEKLLAYFNPHKPETCTFTDMNRRNPFTVPRLDSTNALFITDQTSHTARQAQSAIAVVRTEFRAMKAEFSHLFATGSRPNLVDPRTAQLNQHVKEQEQVFETSQRQAKSRGSLIHRKAKDVGVDAALVRENDRVLSGLEMMEKARRQHATENGRRTETSHPQEEK